MKINPNGQGDSTMARGNIYVGIDLHKYVFSYAMLDESGAKIESGKRTTSPAAVCEFAAALDSRHQVVLEPLTNSFWFASEMAPFAGSVHLANSYKVKLIAASRLKNDRIDAQILADLLRVGYLPEVYIPSPEVLRWRSLVSHRIRLVRDRIRLKNRILGIINREGHQVKASDVASRKGRAELDSLKISTSLRRMVDDYLMNLDLLSSQIKGLDEEIEQIVAADRISQLLETIDGIGAFTALAIRAAVGEMSRFKSFKAFASYTGLIPGYRQSADSIRNTSITKQGVTTLRWLLIQAVPHAAAKSDYLRRLYYRILFRSSVGKAKVAVAHALARIIYHVWMEARPYYR
jgi:transposase